MSNFQKISKKEYKGFFDKALFSTFFHNPEWHDFLENEFNWLKFEYYSHGNRALLAFGRIGNNLISLPFCEYGGPLPLEKGFDFNGFRKDILSEFGENIKMKLHPETLKHFKDPGAVKNSEAENFTSWIEIFKDTTEEQLLNSFRKTLRHEIRDAQKENLTIKKCENLWELGKFYNLYVSGLKRRKTIPYPFSVIKFLYGNKNVEVMLAVKDNKIVGGNLFINYNKFVHYFLSASDLRHKDLKMSHLLLWTKIRGLIGRDVILDLGATPKDSSLDIFKRGWGGKEYPIIRIGIKKGSERFRSSKLRNVWGLLPDFIVKKLSSKLIKYRI